MKKHLLTFPISILFFLIFSENTYAQRDAGGYSVGSEDAYEQKLTNFPNSFNTSTTIKYDVPVEGKVIIKIYNSIGQEITTLVNGDIKSGSYKIELNATTLSRGNYICRYSLLANNKVIVITRMLSVIK